MTVLAEAGLISVSYVKMLGKTLCLCLVAVSMDLVWGYCGILSLGHMAFFGIGGYAIGMWLMRARTEDIVAAQLLNRPLPPTPQEVDAAAASQIFGVVGSDEFPWLWTFADMLGVQLAAVVLVPGLLALVFGWLAFRSRVTGVYLSILTQAGTLALSLWLFQNDSGLRGNNGLSGLQNVPGLTDLPQSTLSVWFLWASAAALGLGYVLAAWTVAGRFGSVIRGIRDDEARARFLGYDVERYKLVVFTGTAMVAGVAGALYYPQAGIVNPAEIAPIASIYLAVWVAIGGRGRLWGAILGAAAVSLLSSWFTGGGAPDIDLGAYVVAWTDWWLVLLGFGFVAVTLFAPEGLSGAFERLFTRRPGPGGRHGARHVVAPPRGGRRPSSSETGGMSALLEVSGVTKTFDGFRAIDNLSFSIGEPELRAVIGPNGAGKTTFMDLVTGKTRPDSGTIRWGATSRDLTRLSESRIAREGIGRKFQKPTVFEAQTVWENLRMALRGTRGPLRVLASRRMHHDRIAALAAQVGLEDALDLRAGTLSHGQKQWLEIGMLLAQDPRLLLVDEPAAGMTGAEREKTTAMLVDAARTRAVVVVEHDMEFVRRLDCRVTVLHEGRVLAEGNLDHVTADSQVIDVYLGRQDA